MTGTEPPTGAITTTWGDHDNMSGPAALLFLRRII